ncbi:MAG: SRPBCC family protein [Methylococcales bacterium]|nr:SRPBCC family protein [Methylococcales bacterium]
MGQCYNSTVIHAPIETVWSAIRNFHELSWGSAIIAKVDTVGDKSGTEVGAKRILNDAFHETLVSLDDEAFSFAYSIDDGPEPVSKASVKNYIGVVKLFPVTDSNHTFIEWRASYESASEHEVGDFCNPLYHALLAALKAGLECFE